MSSVDEAPESVQIEATPVAEAPAEVTVATAPVDPGILETRKLLVDGIESEFDVLVIDKPAKWLNADQIKKTYELVTSGGRVVEIPVRCISFGEWEDIEYTNQFPEVADELDVNEPIISKQRQKLMQAEQDLTIQRRRVAVFEVSTGNKIPGATVDEKVKWLGKLGSGDADALFDYILTDCSGWSDAVPSLLADYKRANRSKSIQEAVRFTGFEDLIGESSAVNSFFRMQRPLDKFILEFLIKHISDEDKKAIEDATPDPIPPSRPGKNPVTGKTDPNFPKYNYNDARYLELSQTAMRTRTTMWLEALLSFPIPGSNTAEKYDWIRAKPLGDMRKIKNFIQNEVISYQGRVSFF